MALVKLGCVHKIGGQFTPSLARYTGKIKKRMLHGEVIMDMELTLAILRAVYNPALNKRVKEIIQRNVTPITYEATLEGDGAIAQGEGATAIGAGSISIEGEVEGDFVAGDKFTYDENANLKRVEQSPSANTQTEKTFQKIAEGSSFVIKQLKISYAQAREQAFAWFRFSIIAAVVGLLLIVAGITILLLGLTTEGIIITISSIIPNVISGLFFVQSKASNERVDLIQRQLSESREIHTAIEIANSIETKKGRDTLKAEIIRRVISNTHNSVQSAGYR